jgi:hypothetical protein
MRLFGPWRQPLTFSPGPAPTEAACYVCERAFQEDDIGAFLPSPGGAYVPLHNACVVLLFMGHEYKVCACHGWSGCVAEDGSPRLHDAARLAIARMSDPLEKTKIAERVRSRFARFHEDN